MKRVLKSTGEFVRALFALRKRKHLRSVDILTANTYADLPAVLRGLLSNSKVKGDQIQEYEQLFSDYHGGGHSYSFAAGRIALAAVLEALKIGPGDEVILPGFTCVAVPNPVLFRNAVPVYVDIDPRTYNIDSSVIEKAITARTKAILVQHTFGLPAEMDPLMEIANRRGLAIIEDCTHALGARYGGRLVGTIGDAAFFSSEQSKVVSTGMGGLAYTKDGRLADKIASFQGQCGWPDDTYVRQMIGYVLHLILLNGPLTLGFGEIVSYYLKRAGVIQEPETTEEEFRGECPANFYRRLPNGLARLGISQMNRLDQGLARRREIAKFYDQRLPELGFETPFVPSPAKHIYLRYPIRVSNKSEFYRFMKAQEVGTGVWFTSTVHPAGVKYEDVLYKKGSCPNAEDAVGHVANLPTHPRMNMTDAERVVRALRKYQEDCGHIFQRVVAAASH